MGGGVMGVGGRATTGTGGGTGGTGGAVTLGTDGTVTAGTDARAPMSCTSADPEGESGLKRSKKSAWGPPAELSVYWAPWSL